MGFTHLHGTSGWSNYDRTYSTLDELLRPVRRVPRAGEPAGSALTEEVVDFRLTPSLLDLCRRHGWSIRDMAHRNQGGASKEAALDVCHPHKAAQLSLLMALTAHIQRNMLDRIDQGRTPVCSLDVWNARNAAAVASHGNTLMQMVATFGKYAELGTSPSGHSPVDLEEKIRLHRHLTQQVVDAGYCQQYASHNAINANDLERPRPPFQYPLLVDRLRWLFDDVARMTPTFTPPAQWVQGQGYDPNRGNAPLENDPGAIRRRWADRGPPPTLSDDSRAVLDLPAVFGRDSPNLTGLLRPTRGTVRYRPQWNDAHEEEHRLLTQLGVDSVAAWWVVAWTPPAYTAAVRQVCTSLFRTVPSGRGFGGQNWFFERQEGCARIATTLGVVKGMFEKYILAPLVDVGSRSPYSSGLVYAAMERHITSVFRMPGPREISAGVVHSSEVFELFTGLPSRLRDDQCNSILWSTYGEDGGLTRFFQELIAQREVQESGNVGIALNTNTAQITETFARICGTPNLRGVTNERTFDLPVTVAMLCLCCHPAGLNCVPTCFQRAPPPVTGTFEV